MQQFTTPEGLLKIPTHKKKLSAKSLTSTWHTYNKICSLKKKQKNSYTNMAKNTPPFYTFTGKTADFSIDISIQYNAQEPLSNK